VSRPLLLIRHGQIAANAGGRWHGSTDSPLNRRGRRQIRRLALRLQRDWNDVAAVYSSPLVRCVHTAQALAASRGQVVTIDDDLREYGIGELEDTPFATLQKDHDFFRRIREDHDYAPTGGDSINAVARRIVAALRRIAEHDESSRPIAVVSHGAALSIGLASLLDDDLNAWTNYQIDNCSVTELRFEPKPLVAMFNDTDHL
jgi:broad specificity phosphatase PhoE